MRRSLTAFLCAFSFLGANAAVAAADELHLDPVNDTVTVSVQDTQDGKRLVFNGGTITLTQARADALADQLETPAPPPPPPPPAAKCDNGLDDDQDGLVDLADPGCENAQDNDESNVVNPPPPPPTGSCNTTVSSTSGASSAISNASAGDVVCLANGTYGSFTVSAQKTGKVTLTAANPGSVTVGRVTVGGRNIEVSKLIASGFTVAPNASFITIDSNRVTTGGHAIGAYGDSGRISNVVITNNELVGLGRSNSPGAENDLIRLQYFDNVRVEHNKLRNIHQFTTGCPSGGCGHSDILQTVHGGTNLTFKRNWITEQSGTQGFFIKDGAVTGLVLEDNLIENDPSGNGYPISIYDVTNGLVTRNTVRNDPGNVAARGSGNRNITVSQNQFQRPWQCETGSQCTVTNGTPAGITWEPGAQTYGP